MSASRKIEAAAVIAAVCLTCCYSAAAATLRVTDVEKRPVKDARIELWAPAMPNDPRSIMPAPMAQARTDTDGMAELPIPALEGLLLLIDHPGHAPWSRVIAGGTAGGPVRLLSGKTWNGRVGFPGAELRGGRICARWQDDFEKWAAHPIRQRCTTLSDRGEFTLPGLPDGEVELRIRAAGYLPLNRNVRPDPRVELRLELGVLLSGKVVGPDKTPVADASIRTRADARASSAADGAFEIAVESLPAVLEVGARGFKQQQVTVRKDEADREILVALVAGEQLMGTFLGDQGEPLEKARLWLEYHQPRGRRRSRTHNIVTHQGDFVLDLPGPGLYHLRAGAADFRDDRLPEIEVAAGETYALGIIVLNRGAGVRGRILDDAANEPIPGADVELVPQGTELFDFARWSRRKRTTSDAQGAFLLSGLDAGRYELRLRHDGFATACERFDLARDQIRDLGDVWLGPGLALRGRTVDREGSPRPGLTVRVFDPAQETLLPIVETETGQNGEFDGPELMAGRYRVRVLGERLLLTQEFEIPAGEEEFSLELMVGGTQLEGVVTRHGEPVAGGLVTLTSALDPSFQRGKIMIRGSHPGQRAAYGLPETSLSAEVTREGTFRLADSPAGALWVSYVGGDVTPATRRIWVPDQPRASVVVEIGGVDLRGQLVDRDSEVGVEGTVRVVGDTGRELARADSDVAGWFTIPGLEPGDAYTVEAMASEYVTASLQGVAVGAEAPPLRLALERGGNGSLRVRLERRDGSPVAGSLATLLNRSGLMAASLPTDSYGRQHFRNLRPGEYFLVWSDAVAGTGISGRIRIEGGESARFERTLPPGAAVALGCDPELCAGAAIDFLALYSTPGPEISPYLPGVAPASRFSAGGAFALGRLSPGGYSLRLGIGGVVWEQSFVVASDDILVHLP